MKSVFAASREFVRGAARYHDLCYLLSKGKALLAQDIAHTSAICVDQDEWADAVNTAWDSTAIAVAKSPAEKLVFVGEDGDVCTYVGGESGHEKIEPAPALIRNAGTINGEVFACGMKRQVYRRIDEDKWVDISAPLPDTTQEAGFEAIDGYTDKEIYAVGWGGEVWQFDGSHWERHSSPTNLILSAVCCAPNGIVYAAGRQGTLIRGRGDSWETVTWDDEIADDLWDLCWFQDTLYVATMTALYTLNDGALVSVNFGEAGQFSCYSLTTSEGVLWSIGRDDVASFDGKSWRRYD